MAAGASGPPRPEGRLHRRLQRARSSGVKQRSTRFNGRGIATMKRVPGAIPAFSPECRETGVGSDGVGRRSRCRRVRPRGPPCRDAGGRARPPCCRSAGAVDRASSLLERLRPRFQPPSRARIGSCARQPAGAGSAVSLVRACVAPCRGTCGRCSENVGHLSAGCCRRRRPCARLQCSVISVPPADPDGSMKSAGARDRSRGAVCGVDDRHGTVRWHHPLPGDRGKYGEMYS